MNIKNTFLKLAQKLGSGILYGRPVLESKCWVFCIQSWRALVAAKVMGSGAGESSGEEHGKAAPFAAVSFSGFLPPEGILLRKSGWSPQWLLFKTAVVPE